MPQQAEKVFLPSFLALCMLHPGDEQLWDALRTLQESILRLPGALHVEVAWVLVRTIFAAITINAATIYPVRPRIPTRPAEQPTSFEEAEALLEFLCAQKNALMQFPKAYNLRPCTDAIVHAVAVSRRELIGRAKRHVHHEARCGRDDAFWRRERRLQHMLTGQTVISIAHAQPA